MATTTTQYSPSEVLHLQSPGPLSLTPMKQRITEHDFVTLQGQNSSTFRKPPLDGSLNIAMLVDWHARHSPNHTWAVYPKADSMDLQHVTWRHLAYATQKVAAMLQREIRAGPNAVPIVAVLANRDTLTYNALWVRSSSSRICQG